MLTFSGHSVITDVWCLYEMPMKNKFQFMRIISCPLNVTVTSNFYRNLFGIISINNSDRNLSKKIDVSVKFDYGSKSIL